MSGKSIRKKNTTKVPRVDSYWGFLIKKEQAADWLTIVISVAVGCFLVTRTYPFPGTTSDTFGYLWSAIQNIFTYLRPFGYSFFLRIVHKFSDSIYSVIVSQAFIYVLSLGLLLLAVKKYWPGLKSWWFRLFEVVVSFSPAAIFMLDTILSDTLQCSLVFIMLAMLIVMIKEESWVAMIVYVASLFASFHTRYSCMFFPIAFIPILALKGKEVFRVSAIVLTILSFIVFHVQTKANMSRSIGVRQFSTGFEGWQLANNAIHVIPFIEDDEEAKIPDDAEIMELHKFVVLYDRQQEVISNATNYGQEATAAFIWNNDSPLKQYFFRQQQGKVYSSVWVRMGSGLYKQYGKWIILHYPWLFFRYYLLPNIKQVFFTTKSEVIGNYEIVPADKEEIVVWFDFPGDQAMEPRGHFFTAIFLPLMKWIELITWLVLMSSAIFLFQVKRKGDLTKDTSLILWMLFLFGLVYYGTVTFASPIALRYWMPMHAVKLVFAWIAVSESLRIQASQDR